MLAQNRVPAITYGPQILRLAGGKKRNPFKRTRTLMPFFVRWLLPSLHRQKRFDKSRQWAALRAQFSQYL